MHNIARDAFLFRIGEAFIEFFLITGTSTKRKNVQTKTVTIFLLRCKMHDFVLSWWPTTASFNLLSWSQYFPKFMVEKRAHSRLSNRHQMDRRNFFRVKNPSIFKKASLSCRWSSSIAANFNNFIDSHILARIIHYRFSGNVHCTLYHKFSASFDKVRICRC